MTSTLEKFDRAKARLVREYQQAHAWPWVLGFSAGKDSTLLAQLVFEALLTIAPSDRVRPIFFCGNDTQVESPVMADHLYKTLSKVAAAAEALRLPIKAVVTKPEPEQTFWVNVIGRGYPPPNRRFRWCTDRLKIGPTGRFIREQARLGGEVVLLLGVRSAESAARRQSIERHGSGEGELSAHADLKHCWVFTPIVDFTTAEVWELLLQRPCPWGGRHRDLITLYRNAGAGECPMVTERSQAPSCGTSSARFGCWTCTVVVKDRSGSALAEAGFDEYEQLGEFRDWLREFQNDKAARQVERRDGGVTVIEGVHFPGPFTLEAREEILRRLLALQAAVQRPLISAGEVNECKRIWAADLCATIRRIFCASPAADGGAL